MLMGSAAQPRSGTAPNALAASRPPVLMRNSRRPPFDGARSRPDLARSFFMSFPPGAMPVQFSARSLLRDASPAEYRLQYALRRYAHAGSAGLARYSALLTSL